MHFFIPEFEHDPAAAEALWQQYLRQCNAPLDSRRGYSVVYMHNGDRYSATVGDRRLRYRRRTGPRGGYIPNAEIDSFGSPTGTVVSGIVDAGRVIYVFSNPPFDGWEDPSMIGFDEVEKIVRFDELPTAG